MRPTILTAILASGILLLSSRAARADDGDTASPPVGPPLLLSFAATGGFAEMMRSERAPKSVDGMSLGGEIRVHPYSHHGAVLGGTFAYDVFGPDVVIIDTTYSYRIGELRPPRGVSVVAYLDAGPSFAFVNASRAFTGAGTGPSEGVHHVLGGRASVAADLQLWAFTIGGVVGYRGGFPVDQPADPWEGAFTASLRVGGVLDIGAHDPARRASRPRPSYAARASY